MRRVTPILGALIASACAAAPINRMQRALDPSMERVLRTENYLRNVAGITGTATRLMRGDGFIYLSDLAPQLEFLADMRDTVRYRTLRTFIEEKMIRRDAAGWTPWRRYRADAAFEAATPYGYHWLAEGLAAGWGALGDTASAVLIARVVWPGEEAAKSYAPSYRFTMQCEDAEDVSATDRARGRALLKTADAQLKALAIRGSDAELDVVSCLTRLAVSVEDPDATVRYLDRMLDIVAPFLEHSARPDAGTSADVLMTLHRVRVVGPTYFDGR